MFKEYPETLVKNTLNIIIYKKIFDHHNKDYKNYQTFFYIILRIKVNCFHKLSLSCKLVSKLLK